jgi:nucleoside 2-deoxyribosyltransferase
MTKKELETPQPAASGSVYLSGPITGLSYKEARYGWRKYVAERLYKGIKPLSPMRHEGHLEEIPHTIVDSELPDHFFSRSKAIVEKDLLDIRRSDIVLVNLLGATEVSRGTLVEIGMAAMANKTIVTLIEPKGNPNDSFFVREPSALVLEDVDDAIYAVNSLLSEGL